MTGFYIFQDETITDATSTTNCVALTFNADDTYLTVDIASKIEAFSDFIQQHEHSIHAEDSLSSSKQIELALKFIKNSTKPENIHPFKNVTSIKSENAFIIATSHKSLFEILVSIQYATVASHEITIFFDKEREYLKQMLLTIFKIDAVEINHPITETPSYCSQIIFDSADFQSAINVLATACNDTTVPWKIRTCWIQDTLRTKFLNSFPSLLTNTRQLNEEQKLELEHIVTKSKHYDATVIQSEDKNATFLVGVTKKHIDSDLCVVVNFFRTPQEVVSLVQATDKTNSISVWSESISLAYDVADKLDVENIWINSNGVLHPDIPFTFGRGAEQHIYGSKFGIIIKRFSRLFKISFF